MSDDNKTKWVYGEVEPQTHSAVLRIASIEGLHHSHVIKLAVEKYVVDYAKSNGEDSVIVVEAAHQELKQTQRQIAQLKNLAYQYVATDDEAKLEKLVQLCEMADIDVNDLLQEVQSSPLTAQIVSHTDKRLNDAQIWLLEILEGNDHELPSKEIMRAAEQRGFSEWTIKKAKQALGDRVFSERRSSHWVWRMDLDSVQDELQH